MHSFRKGVRGRRVDLVGESREGGVICCFSLLCFCSRFGQAKGAVLHKLKEAIDKSPKGSLDAPIVDMVHYINGLGDYVRPGEGRDSSHP